MWFEKAGFHILGLIDLDKVVSGTLKFNLPIRRVINDDIANILCLDLEVYLGVKRGALDLLSGENPHQPFSYEAGSLGLETVRVALFYRYAKFLDKPPLAAENGL